MSLKTSHVLYLALSLVAGGILGNGLRIEEHILKWGEALRSLVQKTKRKNPVEQGEGVVLLGSSSSFARGFLESSVLFCVGAMAILGSIQAGTSGDSRILLTKSVMDGFIAVLLAAGLGLGVMASAISVLIYQGSLTLLATSLQPFIGPTVLDMISSVGGPMVMMIGINLLGLKVIPVANFLPALVLAICFALADPLLPAFLRG